MCQLVLADYVCLLFENRRKYLSGLYLVWNFRRQHHCLATNTYETSLLFVRKTWASCWNESRLHLLFWNSSYSFNKQLYVWFGLLEKNKKNKRKSKDIPCYMCVFFLLLFLFLALLWRLYSKTILFRRMQIYICTWL